MPGMPKPEFTCSVSVRHLPDQSDSDNGASALAYYSSIRNTGSVTAHLIARYLIITGARGHPEEGRGLAVVGQQPLLKPGERFECTSLPRIATRQGSMRGTF